MSVSDAAVIDRVPDASLGALVVLFEDDWLIAIDKPPGLLSQPGLSERDSVSERVRLGRPDATGSLMMHRLDMDTSGVILLAKTPSAHRDLQQQFERRLVRKRYVARVERALVARAGIIDLPLRLDVDRRPMQRVCHAQGRAAQTVWHRAPHDDCTVVLLPRTGRTHQLRVHLAAGMDNPIVGDRLYGTAGERLLLHAARLCVSHPVTGEALQVDAPLPEWYRASQ